MTAREISGDERCLSLSAIEAPQDPDHGAGASPTRRSAEEVVDDPVKSPDGSSLPSSRTFRERSPEFGAIRVQVEDITDDVGDFKSLQPTGLSLHSDNKQKAENVIQAKRSGGKEMKRPSADWTLPNQYFDDVAPGEDSSSFEKMTSNCPLGALEMQLTSVAIKNGPQAPSKPLSMLEQIVRTHNIWYLPHLSRPEVLHFLRNVESGNFIVRASSRINCMALSVRLGPHCQIEIDHYIIEKLPASLSNRSRPKEFQSVQLVRLEGSQLTFRTLPSLIEHYCTSCEELETRLALPAAVRGCRTTKDLQSLALLGQGFWTVAMSRGKSSTFNTEKVNTGEEEGADAGSTHSGRSEGFYAHARKKSLHSDAIEIVLPKKRLSSMRCSRPADVAGCSTNTDVRISRTERRSQSLRNHKRAMPALADAEGETRTPTLSRLRPRSFLKSLFFGQPGDKQKPNNNNNNNNCTFFQTNESVDDFGPFSNCNYSTWHEGFVKSSRSAFDITSHPKRGIFDGARSGRSHQNQAANVDELVVGDYFRGWKPSLAGSPANSPDASPRSRANMRTFKPGGDSNCVVVETSSRPLVMRRELSDICDASLRSTRNAGLRLARHNESSPGPASLTANPSKTPCRTWQQKPMTPPQNASDPQVIRNCVEELRRKRLQSPREMLNASTSSSSSSNSEREEATTSEGVQSAGLVVMRKKTLQRPWDAVGAARNPNNRLSVPNLCIVADRMVPESVEQSAKALKEKMGRNPDGELSAINEGLVTPVVRRKNFNCASRLLQFLPKVADDEHVYQRGNVTDSLEPSDSSFGRRRLKEVSLPTCSQPIVQKFSSERSDRPAGSELVWRRSKVQRGREENKEEEEEKGLHNAERVPSDHQKGKGQHCVAKLATLSWSAVNWELKERQKKIATRSTGQPRRSQRREMVGGKEVSPSGPNSHSDYAQLADVFLGNEDNSRTVYGRVSEEDNVSVTGTVFNEPWDSNVWENLLDLAHHSDGSTHALKGSDSIQEEEDPELDCIAGVRSSVQRADDDEDYENLPNATWAGSADSFHRTLPSDRVTVKAWDHSGDESNCSTLKYRTCKLNREVPRLSREARKCSSTSLARTLSRHSHAVTTSLESLDDLPTALPSMSPLLGHRSATSTAAYADSSRNSIGRSIQIYVEQLARVTQGPNACFGLTLREFLACTAQTKVTDPTIVVRNVRQFINGLKNYLVKSGEGELHAVINEESSRLSSDRILNIDAVLESVLHKLLLRELKPLLYQVMTRELMASGTIQALAENIAIARRMSLEDFGFSDAVALNVPSTDVCCQMKNLLQRMKDHYSPMKKLEYLMKVVFLVISSQKPADASEEATSKGISSLPAAADLVRWLVFILSRATFVLCEVEAWYMWELLPQPILTQSDASYYLTALFSAVHVLKSREQLQRLCDNNAEILSRNAGSRHFPAQNCGADRYAPDVGVHSTCDAFVRVAVPNETIGCLKYTTLPSSPQLTTAKLCRVIARQHGIANPEEHGLYVVMDEYETCLPAGESPVLIHEQLRKDKKVHLFAYKRHEAKIAWPDSAFH